MAYLFGDGFDIYASRADLLNNGRWSASASWTLSNITPFGAGQSVFLNSSANASFTTKTNETTVYGSIRLHYNSSTSANTNSAYLTFYDGTAAQCSIVWVGDGSISLYSGNNTGTLIQSNAAMFSLNGWDSYQFCITFSKTTGSIQIRKNGSNSAIINATNINTQLNSANSYTNFFSLGAVGANWYADDFYLNSASGAAPNTWPGDMRCFHQRPQANVQSQFTPVVSASPTIGSTNSGFSSSVTTGVIVTSNSSLFPSKNSILNSMTVGLNASITGNLQGLLYDSSGNFIAKTAEVVNPTAGQVTLTFSSPPTLYSNNSYWLAVWSNTTWKVNYSAVAGSNILSYSSTYNATSPPSTASFSTALTSTAVVQIYGNLTITNSGAVDDGAEDGDNSYVQANTVGNQDIYTLNPISNSYSIVGVNYHVMWRVSEFGGRGAQVLAGVSNGALTPVINNSTLNTSYLYNWVYYPTDVNSVAWTPNTVNSQQISLKVTA